MKNISLVLFLILFAGASFGQRVKKTHFKLMASFTGLGAAVEYNPASVVFLQGGATSTFTVTRLNLQSKLAVFRSNDFAIKVGVEGAYFIGDLKVGGFKKEYDPLEFMPLVAFEWKVVGLEIPVIIEPDLSGFFPLLGITLNVTNDEKNPGEKRKRRKDFQRQPPPP